MPRENLLMVGDSVKDADMYYAVGMFVPDPFIYLEAKGKPHIVISDLEIDRARKEARHCQILSLSHYQKRLRRQGQERITLADVIYTILKEKRLHRVLVPDSFPYGIAAQLLDKQIEVRAHPGPVFPQRETKSPSEVKKISATLMMAEVGLAEGIQVLKRSKIGKGNRLFYRNLPLTAEKLRGIIDTAVLQAGGMARDTIVACGQKSCDPHERGQGPLRAHRPIILDIFPRSQKTGYFGDITRTVVRGRATEGVRKIYHHVLKAQELAWQNLHPSRSVAEVHQAVQKFFDQRGFFTEQRHGRMQGFFHSTGHGLGLELHEPPKISANSQETLKPGHVVTIEPGLYYSSIGGVRLEDVVLIGRKSPQNLTKFEKVLEI